MNIKELRQVRKELVERFGMDENAPTTAVVRRLIDEERLFAEYPDNIVAARAFLRAYTHAKQWESKGNFKVRPIPEGFTRQGVGL